METFTAEERAALAPYFTELDGPVFALVNLPEVVKGALFARYSRYPGTLRRLFLDEFADSLPAHAGEWDTLMTKLVSVTTEYSAEQVRAGADAIQIFDSWVGCLSVEDYRRYVLPHVSGMVKKLKKTGVPIIYFGTDSATLLPSMKETGAEVVGLDWRIPLDQAWR